MKPADDIHKLVRKLQLKASVGLDRRVHNDISRALAESEKTESAHSKPNIWRIIMKRPIMKLAAAAAIIIATLIGIHHFSGSINPASVAWGDVVRRTAHVDYVHVYYFKSRGNDLGRYFEAWYAHGKMVIRGNRGEMTYDDGQTSQGFDENAKLTVKKPSMFAEGKTFLELFTGGLLSDKNEQLSTQTPTDVGDDFLIYEFDASPDESDFIKGIFITVGKNSLLPIQVKVYHKDSDYDLIMFDYEAPQKPAEFFEPPTIDAPNGRCEVLLDGKETAIDIEGAPGLKQAIVRLHSKYDGPADQFPMDYIRSEHLAPDFCRAVSDGLRKTYKKKGGPVFRLDVYFVTDEGYRSSTNEIIALWLNEAGQCGVGSENDGVDNWPDGKYRNIKFSPLLKPTGKEDTYIVEIRCGIKTKED
jgi:hypothetical protein